jgi:hypothetical protein
MKVDMTDLPDPLVPAEVDLRDFGFMPLDVLRLRDSDLATLASGAAFKAAVLLWCVAWHQHPAASLPSDDRLLANYSGAGASWHRVREMALRGFVKCSDGRLYHAVIAAKAKEAWEKKAAQRERTRKATEERERRRREADAQRDVERNDLRNGQRNVERDVHQGTGTGTGTGTGIQDPPEEAPDGASQGEDLKSVIFGRGLTMLAKLSKKPKDSHRAVVGKWCRDFGDAAVIAAFEAARMAQPIEPVAFIAKTLQEEQRRRSGNGRRNGNGLRHASIEERAELCETENARRQQDGKRPLNMQERRDYLQSQGIQPNDQ